MPRGQGRTAALWGPLRTTTGLHWILLIVDGRSCKRALSRRLQVVQTQRWDDGDVLKDWSRAKPQNLRCDGQSWLTYPSDLMEESYAEIVADSKFCPSVDVALRIPTLFALVLQDKTTSIQSTSKRHGRPCTFRRSRWVQHITLPKLQNSVNISVNQSTIQEQV